MKAIVLSAKSSIRRSSLRRGFFLIPVVLACFGLAPMAQAVVPAPDGGYPNGNTAEGTNALLNLTNGIWNTALGFEALNHDTAGKDNSAQQNFQTNRIDECLRDRLVCHKPADEKNKIMGNSFMF